MLQTELHILLGTRHVALQVTERNLRLNHPEFSEVASRVRFLRPKGRPESVDARHGARIDFSVELSGDRQVRWLEEEVFRVVDLAGFGVWEAANHTRRFLQQQQHTTKHTKHHTHHKPPTRTCHDTTNQG